MNSKKKILLVDDDPAFREINRMVLETSGYEVEEADSKPAALEKIRSTTFDLVILDLMMEERDSGFQLAYALRQEEATRTLPILMLTSAEEKTGFSFDVAQDREWMKVDDYAAKPLKPAELIARVEKMLQKGKT
ncbi:response regulator [candidate division KSB1 bacterium]|nr:response regulator [candidate division KSB1 bacterium]